MLEDIELITNEYLYHCVIEPLIASDKTTYMKMCWYANRRLGKVYEYSSAGVLIGKWTYNVKGQFSVGRSEIWNEKGNLTGVCIFDRHGVILESEKYYESGELFCRKIYKGDNIDEYTFHKNGVCSGHRSHYKYKKYGLSRRWDENGIQIDSFDYGPINSGCYIL